MSQFKFLVNFLQKTGRAMMLPVAILPVAGLLLGVGSSDLGFISPLISELMIAGGKIIFDNLPIIFAIGVALGFTDNDGVSAIAAVVGYLVMNSAMSVVAISVLGLDPNPEARELSEVLGIDTISTGVFGGILLGGVSAAIFNRFHQVELPAYLAFFSGKRLVPILTGMAALLLGVTLSFIWPRVNELILIFSQWAAYTNPTLAGAIYGFVERLLLPMGLHHAWNVPFFFEIGSYVDKTGLEVHGDINRFFAGDPTAGILSGGFLTKMWGLPMAAIAIWRVARPKERARVGGIMLSAALTSFLTGITEPIEFSFMFVAPWLYFLHAIFTGTAFALMNYLGAHEGYTFSQGGLDFFLYFAMDTKPWLIFIVGPLYGLLYFVTFRTLILKFDLKTPGREDDVEGERPELAPEFAGETGRSRGIIWALGGRDNIETMDNCITRLRVQVKDPALVDAPTLKSLGAAEVVEMGQSIQAIFGTKVAEIKNHLDEYLKTAGEEADRPTRPPKTPKSPATQSATTTTTAANALEPASTEELSRLKDLLGGAANIESVIPTAATRLLVTLKDRSLARPTAALKAGLPFLTPAKEGTAIQVIVGPRPERFQGLKT
ncbi:MAG: glucose-specific PTS transporter subunit IIBC [Deltaproteobacteria bacterium]|jgi:PTS system glucose-specific IIC component|nr:glucose-specific PTS transporter subunit IIBC [Deltaproteobacteria bacterium]